ncbi:MAG: hypothetical protein GXO79_04945 [Chlorobi bacterium]|nr:hypothetical protein [Chlorobiota bacterium]
MDKNLSWFIGPKAENGNTFVELMEIITQDYFHWRKNYFPNDPLLLNKSDQRNFDIENDKLNQNVNEFIAKLRRNFPFYNPRYIAHMLSDTTMPAMLGYYGAMLYNANNVTPEAAPVTTELEIESCNEIINMLGFKPSPTPPSKEATIDDWKKYQNKLKDEFGWAHITSGGTIANIEALWVARSIKYAPLAIQEVAKKDDLKLEIEVKLANHYYVSEDDKNDNVQDIKNIDKYDLINIKPNESIYLLSKYIKAYHKKNNHLDLEKAGEKAIEELNNAKYSLSNNLGRLLTEFPLAIFVSGTAHYSVKKAADILGVGRNNIKNIEIDSQFRADISKLKGQLKKCRKEKISPLAVIGVAGTTEEGAIDPIDKIVELREEFEKEQNISFWLHVDAAWGGYVKTIMALSGKEEYELLISKILTKINNIHQEADIKEIKDYFNYSNDFIIEKITEIESKVEVELKDIRNFDKSLNHSNCQLIYSKLKKEYWDSSKMNTDKTQLKDLKNKIDSLKPIIQLINDSQKHKTLQTEQLLNLENIDSSLSSNEFSIATKSFEKYIINSEYQLFNNNTLSKDDFKISLMDRVDELALYTNDNISLSYKNYTKSKSINVGNTKEVVSAYLAFKYSDSITIDPHKLGYVPYPNGIIAFRNDRVRHFIMHSAPYITSSKHNALLHNPPMHVNDLDFSSLTTETLPYDDYNVGIDAFAPFILEGSKPGAAAAALWLSNKTIPLTRQAHGSIIKNTLLATRELYEWMISWNKITDNANEDTSYEFLPISPMYPDLNVFVFTIKVKNISSLECMNKFASLIYDKFSIQAEFGDKNHSYAQPFFLSKTTFTSPNYNFSALSDFFKKNNIRNARNAYKKHDLLVLRATLMSPYIYPYKKEKNVNLIKEFIVELHKISEQVSQEIVTKYNRQQCI